MSHSVFIFILTVRKHAIKSLTLTSYNLRRSRIKLEAHRHRNESDANSSSKRFPSMLVSY